MEAISIGDCGLWIKDLVFRIKTLKGVYAEVSKRVAEKLEERYGEMVEKSSTPPFDRLRTTLV